MAKVEHSQSRLPNVAIVTSGRFHVCDLARELRKLGHPVTFYSWVPPWRLRKFGLDPQEARWMLPKVLWRSLRFRWAKGEEKETQLQRLIEAYDRSVAHALEPCDVLIGMAGLCNQLGRKAKEAFGAQLWIERGSRHILSQRRIMQGIPGAKQVSDETVARELQDYSQADYVAVLTKHCEESFLEEGFPAEKLVRNPLGVDLSKFQPTPSPPRSEPTIIMTGAWSYRKGCDLLVEAWRGLPGVRLMHVGSVGDCPLPNDEGFVHVDKVDQSRLIEFYSQAHVFALASHEEGLATVQPQALACGLRLVCTTRTGGEDLLPFVTDSDVITVVEPGDVQALRQGIEKALKESLSEEGLRQRLLPNAGDNLSWTAYAKRYSEALVERISRNK